MRHVKYISLIGSLATISLTGCASAPSQERATLAEEGARVWRVTCDRCHTLRAASEYSLEQWPIIVSHMRTRQDLTRSEAEAVSAFLTELADRQPSP